MVLHLLLIKCLWNEPNQLKLIIVCMALNLVAGLISARGQAVARDVAQPAIAARKSFSEITKRADHFDVSPFFVFCSRKKKSEKIIQTVSQRRLTL